MDLQYIVVCLSLPSPSALFQLVEDGFDLLLQYIDRCWSFVSELQDSLRPFLSALEAFVGVAFHPDLLSVGDAVVVDMHRKVGSRDTHTHTRTWLYCKWGPDNGSKVTNCGFPY